MKKNIALQCMEAVFTAFISFYAFYADAQQQTTPQHRPFSRDSVRMIWDSAPHNAFTDLIYFKKKWYCVFREANQHFAKDDFGKIRIIRSKDGRQWSSVGLLSEDSADMRDPKLSITPNNRLMLNYGVIRYKYADSVKKDIYVKESAARFSRKGTKWSCRHKMNFDDEWAWRVKWYNDTAYTITYTYSGVNLYKSADGINYDFVSDIKLKDKPNEAGIVFLADTMLTLIRCEENNTFYIGESVPPYKEWYIRKSERFVGAPNLIKLPDNSVFATFRGYEGGAGMLKLAIIKHYKLYPLINILSGGDCGYAGMYLQDNVLWVSYYSSHQGKASIYLTKINFR